MNSLHLTRRENLLVVELDIEPVNVLDREAISELRDLIRDEEAPVLALSGKGKLFSAGVSVDDHLPGDVEEAIPEFVDLARELLSYPGLTASLVHGKALGGACELALCTDLLYAEEKAAFGLPEIKLGVFPPVACALLPKFGRGSLLKRMVFTGKEMSARELKDHGIVTETFEDEEKLRREALKELSSCSLLSKPVLKLAVEVSSDHMEEIERRLQKACQAYLKKLMSLDDPVEGLNAFLEERSPNWTHA